MTDLMTETPPKIKPARAMISSQRIARRVRELGKQISEMYSDIETPLVMIVILKGATVFAADLLRSLTIPAELEFVSAASYGSGTSSSGHVRLAHMVEGPLVGRHVLLVEDIIDSGRTVDVIAKRLKRMGPASLRLAALLDRPAPEHQRDRVLTADELRAVWKTFEGEDEQTAALFKLYLLTAQRGGELRAMEWSELDLDAGWWVIPAEKAKNKLAHRVPLSPHAAAILRTLREQGNGSRWVFPRYAEDKYTVYRAADRIRTASGVDFKPHDLRRSVATFLTSELGVSRLVVSKLLNHVETGVTKVYDRASYDREKQTALVAWGTRLEAIVTGTTGAKVMPLRA